MITAKQHHLDQAHQLALEFSQRRHTPAFVGIDRLEVFDGLERRIDKPHLIFQGSAGICGSSAILYNYALHDRVGYTKLVINLYERGEGNLRHWKLAPSRHLRHHGMAHKARITPADWMPLASIRDCENWFFDYQSATNKGGTHHDEMADIFKKAGFHDVRDRCTDFHHGHHHVSSHREHKLIELLKEATHLKEHKYCVALLMDSGILKGNDPVGRHNHWVALASRVHITGASCHFKVFTWGRIRSITPKDEPSCPLSKVADYFYGYVACRY